MASLWAKVWVSATLGATVMGPSEAVSAAPQLREFCTGADHDGPGNADAMAMAARALTASETKAQLDADLISAKAAVATVDDLRQRLEVEGGVKPGEGYAGAVYYAKLSREANDPIRKELFRRAALDVFWRSHVTAALTRTNWATGLSDGAVEIAFATVSSHDQCGTDASNTQWLKAQVARRGWFKRSTDGSQADGAAYLLVQHADRDRAFQKQVLEVLQSLLPLEEIRPSNYAYLFDRVATGEGRPQRYGSQGNCTGPHTWTEFAVEDPTSLDQLRATVGLGPEETYRKSFERLCP